MPQLRSIATGTDENAKTQALNTLRQHLNEGGVTSESIAETLRPASPPPGGAGGAGAAQGQGGAAPAIEEQRQPGMAMKAISVSQPSDPAEVEADRVADAVVSGGAATVRQSAGQRVHRVTGVEVAAGAAVATALGAAAVGLYRYLRERRARQQAHALEARDTGLLAPQRAHSLDRHGPQVSDQQLQDRLTTGVAPDGAPSAAPGMSSRFKSHVEWMATRNAAVNAADAAVLATRAALTAPLTAFSNAITTFLNTAPGAAKGVAGAARAAARTAVDNAVAAITSPNPNQMPVTFQNPVIPNNPPAAALPGLLAAIPNQVQQAVLLRPSYQIVVAHGRAIGESFVGTGAPGPSPAGPGQVWPGTAPGPQLQNTRTTFVVPGAPAPLFTVGPAAGWPAIQHFPVQDPAGISF
jgi:hypothetical protein